MPVYAYECKDCGVRFDRRQSFNDEALRVCPECEGSVHRLIQPAGVIFKGSGFYSTDNRGGKNASIGGGKSEGESKSKSEGGSEAKPAAEKKSESKVPASSSD